VLAGLILILVGAATNNPTRLVIGLGLGSIGGLELSVREHVAGYRSHTTLLAGVGFVLSLLVTYFGFRLVLWVCLAIGAVVGGLIWVGMRQVFRRAAGGLSYRLR